MISILKRLLQRPTVYGKQELSMKAKSRSGVRNTCALPTFMQNEKDSPGYIVSNDLHFQALNDIDWPKLQLVTIQEYVKDIDK